MKQEDDFFVGVNNPLDIRRNMLECSKIMIHTLQSIEKLKTIRQAKHKRIQQLKTISKELELLVTKLKRELPKTKLRAAITDTKDKLKLKSQESYDSMSELEKLEAKLKEVEKEITRLS